MLHQLSVTPATDEELRSPDFQKEMRLIERYLKAQNFEPKSVVLIENSATTGGGLRFLGQFAIDAGKSGALTALIDIARTYLGVRTGRKVRLKTGEIEAEAHSVEELERLLKR